MESIIIQIILGCTGDSADFMLPAHVPVSALLDDIARLAEQVYPTAAFDPKALVLVDMQSGNVLPREWTLSQSRVEDGGKLMLL